MIENTDPAPAAGPDPVDLGEGGYVAELQPGMTAHVMGYVPEDDAK
jgi:hypothetical protein